MIDGKPIRSRVKYLQMCEGGNDIEEHTTCTTIPLEAAQSIIAKIPDARPLSSTRSSHASQRKGRITWNTALLSKRIVLAEVTAKSMAFSSNGVLVSVHCFQDDCQRS